MTNLLVAADDRTGALETAGACADAGLRSVVTPAGLAGVNVGAARCLVLDLASRHLHPARAGAAAAAVESRAAGFHAHKIDSTLRGNWAHELVARHHAGNRRVLLIPAFPAVGRTCIGGVVFEDGLPVSERSAGRDARAPVSSSRPADHLRAAGASDVFELADSRDVCAWLGGEGPDFAVGDAAADSDLERLAALWQAHPDVLLAGTAATIGAAAGAVAGVDAHVRPPRPRVDGPVLVVCGSLHPAARAQVDALVTAGALAMAIDDDFGDGATALRAGRHVVLASARPDSDGVGTSEALSTARALAVLLLQIETVVAVPTVILIGGDTTSAVLGDRPVEVGGTIAPGVAWCRPNGETGSLILAKPGGFGGPTALIDLLAAKMAP